MTNEKISKSDILVSMDGDAWCAVRNDTFVDIQESDCGFGDTPQSAIDELLIEERKNG